jgi:pyruvate ferredoxin oxidoreductase alpha subunit
MAEVIYNIAGMRLPVVMTCANRAVSAPINIWNDQQDVMAIRDAGWIILFAENNQEAVDQHVMAYKIAEKLKLPVMVNVDGFLITHTYEQVEIPTPEQIKKYLPDYKPTKGEYLDPAFPITMGALATPADYMEIREDLQNDLIASRSTIEEEYKKYNKIIPKIEIENRKSKIENSFVEYTGPAKPKTIIVAMGSVIGTIKTAVEELAGNSSRLFRIGSGNEVGILKIKLFRPFPDEEILKIISRAKNIVIIDKSISLGHIGPLASDIKAIAQGKCNSNIHSFVVGLGGRDITKVMIKKIISLAKNKASSKAVFVGK